MVTDGRDIWTLCVALKSLTKPYTGGEPGAKMLQIARWCLSFIKCSRCRRFMHADPRTKLAARDCGSFIEWLLILRLAVSGQRLAVSGDYGSGGSVLQGFGPTIPVALVTVPIHQPYRDVAVVTRPRQVGLALSVVVHHAADAPVGVGTY